MSDDDGSADFLQGLTFTPGWAKAPAGEQRFERFSEDGRDSSSRDRRDRSRDDGRRRPGPGNAAPGLSRPVRPSARPPGGSPDSGYRPERPPFVRRDDVRDRGGYPQQGNRDSRPYSAPYAPPVDYPVEVRFLPEPKALSVVVHKVARGHRAFPVRDLARLFLDNPSSCEVRIEVKPGTEGLAFHQCTRCGWIGLDANDLRNHAQGAHFDEEFVAEEVEGEAPSGVFVCVAKCGFTGKLLAPPNHHSYAQRVQEMLRTECKHVSEDEYRSRIETVRDEAAVQQWREEARKRTLYRRKTAEGLSEEAIERPAAESLFLQEVLPAISSTPKHVACTHAVAMQLTDPVLAPAVQDAWRREQRYPASLFFALRGAFRHKRMHVFRAGEGRGMDFVMAKAPAALDVEHAVPELKAIIDYLTMHPGSTRAEVLHALDVPAEPPFTPEQDRVLQQLTWITERGHVIEYHNGVLALPEEHPVFRTVQVHRAPSHKAPPHKERAAAPKADQPKPEKAKAEASAEVPAEIPVESPAKAEPAPAAEALETVPEAAPEQAAEEIPPPAEPAPAAEATETAPEAVPEQEEKETPPPAESVPAAEAPEAVPEAAPETPAEETPPPADTKPA